MPWRVAYDPADAAQKHHNGAGAVPRRGSAEANRWSKLRPSKKDTLSKVKKSFSEWGDDLCVMVLYNDPRADRLQRRLGQLQRVEDWLQRLSPWKQRLLPVPFALFTGCLGVWLNSLLPPMEPNQLAFRLWLGL